MSKINGHGGFWVNAATLVRIDNAEYDLETDEMIDDVTDSGSGGVAEGLPCIYKVQSLSMSVAEDDTFYLSAIGLNEGQRASMYLKRGAVNQWDLVTNTIVKSARHSNPQDKARRVTITCEYGSLTRNVTPPAGYGG